MLKPAEKTARRPLIHHPSNVLDAFGHYDPSNEHWLQFDDSLTQQLGQFESDFRRYIRVRPESARRAGNWSRER